MTLADAHTKTESIFTHLVADATTIRIVPPAEVVCISYINDIPSGRLAARFGRGVCNWEYLIFVLTLSAFACSDRQQKILLLFLFMSIICPRGKTFTRVGKKRRELAAVVSGGRFWQESVHNFFFSRLFSLISRLICLQVQMSLNS